MSKTKRAKTHIDRLEISLNKVITIRWVLSFIALSCFIIFWKNFESPLFYSSLFLILTSLVITSFILFNRKKNLSKWKIYLKLLEIEEDRKVLNWRGIPEYRSPMLNSDEFDLITGTDLNLIGTHSALHLMDSCISEYGQRHLATSLLKTVPLADIQIGQKKVKELLPLSIFRMKFKLLGRLHSNELITKERLFSLFTSSILDKKFFVIFTLLILVQIVNLVLLMGTAFGEWKPYFLLTAPIIFVLYQMLKSLAGDAFEMGVTLQLSIERLFPVFKIMEELNISERDILYSEFQAFKKNPPSKLLKKINHVVSLLSVRTNPLLGIILNFLLPWNYFLLIRLEKLKSINHAHIEEWMESLGKIEALVSLADFADYTKGIFPDFLPGDSTIYFEAADLTHPLMTIDKRISNSYLINKDSPFAVVTGSNMAGKSTFLRTIGINIALARAGTTVYANEFKIQNLTVMTLIKAQDFLEKEMSLFYFEVRRLKEILIMGKGASVDLPFLFLVDEIYRGTNNQERYQGAVAYLKEFTNIPNCCGLLTTHDINIPKTLLEFNSIKQYHFREMFQNGELVYDYKIQTGICETTNALRIMNKEGLPT